MSWTGFGHNTARDGSSHGGAGGSPGRGGVQSKGAGGGQGQGTTGQTGRVTSTPAGSNAPLGGLPARVNYRGDYSPRDDFQARDDPDLLLGGLPRMDTVLADFNSAPTNKPPYRDISSALVAALAKPGMGREPDWADLLEYFRDKSQKGICNLQDLYVLVTRFLIPNAIIDNRRWLLKYYLQKERAPANIKFRADAWRGNDYIPPASERQVIPPMGCAPRSIFKSHPTPDGAKFLEWLTKPIKTPPPHYPTVPWQTRWNLTQVDLYLNEDEDSVRRMHPEALYKRTAKVLHLFWWIMRGTLSLEYYYYHEWVDLENQVTK